MEGSPWRPKSETDLLAAVPDGQAVFTLGSAILLHQPRMEVLEALREGRGKLHEVPAKCQRNYPLDEQEIRRFSHKETLCPTSSTLAA